MNDREQKLDQITTLITETKPSLRELLDCIPTTLLKALKTDLVGAAVAGMDDQTLQALVKAAGVQRVEDLDRSDVIELCQEFDLCVVDSEQDTTTVADLYDMVYVQADEVYLPGSSELSTELDRRHDTEHGGPLMACSDPVCESVYWIRTERTGRA